VIKAFIFADRPAVAANASPAAWLTHQNLSASARGLVVLDNNVLIHL
jgi:hypothetical protein